MTLDSLDIVDPGAIFQSERQARSLPVAAAKQLPPAWELRVLHQNRMVNSTTYPILSHLIPSYPILSHLIPSYPILSHDLQCFNVFQCVSMCFANRNPIETVSQKGAVELHLDSIQIDTEIQRDPYISWDILGDSWTYCNVI